MTQHASYYEGNTYHPQDMMQRDADWISPGVLSSSDLVVSPGSGLAVNVSGASQGSAGGNAWLPGGYRVYNDAQQTVTLAAASTTYPRIDLIVAAIDTSQSPYVPVIKVITGTPAASPSVPSIPSSLVAITLAKVTVAANATTISTGNIVDMRTIAGLQGDASNLSNLDGQPDFVAHLADNAAHNLGTASLLTTDKTIKGAINELFTNANSGKSSVASAIGSPSTAAETFVQLSSDINTQKSTLATNLTNKGQSSSSSDTLLNLVAKVANIARGQGTAVESQVLNGIPFSNSDGTLRYGNMPNNGAINVTQTASGQVTTIPAGYTPGGSVTNSITVESLGGKHFASGTTSTNSSKILTISGLSFQPRIIILRDTSGSEIEVYISDDSNSGSQNGYVYQTNNARWSAPITINSNGFTCDRSYMSSQSNFSINWWAIE